MAMPIATVCPYGHVKQGFGRRRTLASGEVRQYPLCLICRRNRKLDYARRHPERVHGQNRVTKLKLHYGISEDEYSALLEIQGGRCATCGALPGSKPLAVDHKGSTIRGLLCNRCNLAAGLLRDDPSTANRLGRYLDGNGFVRLIERGKTMKLTIVSTTKKVIVNGVEARVWEGQTESGIPVFCLVTRVAVHKNQDCSQFERELQEHRAPSVEALELFPLRMVL